MPIESEKPASTVIEMTSNSGATYSCSKRFFVFIVLVNKSYKKIKIINSINVLIIKPLNTLCAH